MHLLVIEDNFIISLSIRVALSELGFDTIFCARSEREAIESAHIFPPDFITCDVELDPGSGLDAIAAITAERWTRVLFVTSSGDAVQKRYPTATVIDKPFIGDELAEIVKNRMTCKCVHF